MWLLIILSTLLSASAFDIINDGAIKTLMKCCPKEQSLIKVIENITDYQVLYECADDKSAKKKYSVLHFSALMAYNISVQYGFPENCGSDNYSADTEIEVDISNENGKCYDKLVSEIENGTVVRNIPKIVSLKCMTESYEQFYESKLKVNQIRKCCPKGQAYDVEYHLCRDEEEESTYDSWLRLISQISSNESYLYDVDHGLHCKSDEYSVELSENNFAIDIDGSVLKYSGKKRKGIVHREEWCIDRLFGSRNLVAKVCAKNCDQYGAFCFRKCCRLGEHYEPFNCDSYRSQCVATTESAVFYNVSLYLDSLKLGDDDDLLDVQGLRISLRCDEGKFVLNQSTPATDRHWLRRDGRLGGLIGFMDDYCIELFDWRKCPYKNPIEVTALSCFQRRTDKKNFFFAAITNSISAAALAITLVVYCALPALHNLHGRTIICHVSAMLLAYTCLARVQFQQVENPTLCTVLGYGIYFGFVSAFVWLNVMCYDIWSTFRSMRSVQSLRKGGAERRRFGWYSLYAWSLALLLTLVMYLLDTFPVTGFLKADMGHGTCWFGSEQNSKADWPHYVFFVIPMGVLTCVNLVLWLVTVRHCVRVKSEVHRLQAGSVGDCAKRRFRVDRAKYIGAAYLLGSTELAEAYGEKKKPLHMAFVDLQKTFDCIPRQMICVILTGKLWVVMGASWFAELLSTLFSEPPWLWTAVDLVMQLQGLLVFLILVLKPKVYYLIRKKLGLEKPEAHKNGASSGRTSSTFLSRTISSDERTNLRTSLPSNGVKRA